MRIEEEDHERWSQPIHLSPRLEQGHAEPTLCLDCSSTRARSRTAVASPACWCSAPSRGGSLLLPTSLAADSLMLVEDLLQSAIYRKSGQRVRPRGRRRFEHRIAVHGVGDREYAGRGEAFFSRGRSSSRRRSSQAIRLRWGSAVQETSRLSRWRAASPLPSQAVLPPLLPDRVSAPGCPAASSEGGRHASRRVLCTANFVEEQEGSERAEDARDCAVPAR